ncbi:hypothetical protein U9M48_036874, partial [Paspalum notatum var. saurae]
ADLMTMFYDFYKGDLCLFSLNFGVITLLPKCQEAVKIQQFRPICLSNVSFKIFTKKVIQPSQIAFLPGRYILEGVTILHEPIHELHRKKLNGVIFKVDFEKAYEKVKWPLLQQTLRMKGFSPLWCQWIQDFVSKGSVAVKVNNDVGRYFKTDKGLHDTILFIEHDLEQAKNLKIILCAFEKLSGLKINFHKNELFCYGEAKDYVEHYSRKLLSYGGRLVLINSVLSSLAMFMMSFFEIPKGILKKLDFYRSSFFWQGDNHKKKYRLTKWDILCLLKDQGGMGIRNLEVQNVCLLSKWLFKLINEEGIWQIILKRKYLRGKTIGEVQWKPRDSHFWSGLTKVKGRFLQLSSFILHDGSQIRYWEDRWFGHLPLKIQYPSLYNIARKKNVTVLSVFSSIPLNISFRRALIGEKLQK